MFYIQFILFISILITSPSHFTSFSNTVIIIKAYYINELKVTLVDNFDAAPARVDII